MYKSWWRKEKEKEKEKKEEIKKNLIGKTEGGESNIYKKKKRR